MSKTNFVENIFSPVVQFLDKSITQLNSMTTISMKGVRLDNYFGIFGILGPDWTRTISTFLTCFLFIFILWTIKNYSRILLWFKALVKWW